MRRIPELRCFLKSKGFFGIVLDRAIDRVILAFLPYFLEEKDYDLQDWEAWLFSVGFQSACQEASREPGCELRDPADLPAIAGRSNSEEEKRVHEALDQLTSLQRQAVWFCKALGMSLEEAARKMESTKGAVRDHLHAGLTRLKVILGNHPRP